MWLCAFHMCINVLMCVCVWIQCVRVCVTIRAKHIIANLNWHLDNFWMQWCNFLQVALRKQWTKVAVTTSNDKGQERMEDMWTGHILQKQHWLPWEVLENDTFTCFTDISLNPNSVSISNRVSTAKSWADAHQIPTPFPCWFKYNQKPNGSLWQKKQHSLPFYKWPHTIHPPTKPNKTIPLTHSL